MCSIANVADCLKSPHGFYNCDILQDRYEILPWIVAFVNILEHFKTKPINFFNYNIILLVNYVTKINI